MASVACAMRSAGRHCSSACARSTAADERIAPREWVHLLALRLMQRVQDAWQRDAKRAVLRAVCSADGALVSAARAGPSGAWQRRARAANASATWPPSALHRRAPSPRRCRRRPSGAHAPRHAGARARHPRGARTGASRRVHRPKLLCKSARCRRRALDEHNGVLGALQPFEYRRFGQPEQVPHLRVVPSTTSVRLGLLQNAKNFRGF